MKRFTLVCVLSFVGPLSQAAELDTLQALAQAQFKTLSQDLSSALSYKALAPAEPLGLTGFDVGVEVSATELQDSDVWDTASGDELSQLVLPKLHLHKGLPFNLDVGVVYSSVPDSNISFIGGELRYAVLEGGVATPAVAIRGTYTVLNGVDQLDFSTRGLEVSVSKGFAMFTPYGGIGRIWATSSPQDVALLSEEDISQTKYYAGANFSLGLANLAFEADRTGDSTTWSAKVGVRF